MSKLCVIVFLLNLASSVIMITELRGTRSAVDQYITTLNDIMAVPQIKGWYDHVVNCAAAENMVLTFGGRADPSCNGLPGTEQYSGAQP